MPSAVSCVLIGGYTLRSEPSRGTPPPGDRRDTAHEGAGNAQDVHVPAQESGSSCCSNAVDSTR